MDFNQQTLELRIVLAQMGLDPSEEELEDMISEVDEDDSGTISFIEFVGTNFFFECIIWFDFYFICQAMVKKAVDTTKSSREELFRAFQVFGIWNYFLLKIEKHSKE